MTPFLHMSADEQREFLARFRNTEARVAAGSPEGSRHAQVIEFRRAGGDETGQPVEEGTSARGHDSAFQAAPSCALHGASVAHPQPRFLHGASGAGSRSGARSGRLAERESERAIYSQREAMWLAARVAGLAVILVALCTAFIADDLTLLLRITEGTGLAAFLVGIIGAGMAWGAR